MKIGINLLLWATQCDEALYPTIQRLKQIGFDGVEVPLFEGDPEHYRAFGQVLKDNGLAATTFTVLPDLDRNAVSTDPNAREGAIGHIKWAIDCCAALNASILAGPLYQTWGAFSGDARTQQECDDAVSVLQTCADHAAAANVDLSIEALNRYECNFLNLQNDAADFVEAIDRKNVGILYNTYHANIEEKHPVGAIRHNIAVINHVHIAANDRGTPGKGHIPWASTFATLKENGYDGWLTIEALSRTNAEFAASRRVWRDYFPAPDEVAEFGCQFIRNGWDAS